MSELKPLEQEPWDKDAWVKQSIAVFHMFLMIEDEPFTTAEDVWPLLAAPQGDMRVMVRVIRYATKHNWIKEVGAKRLKGTYFTGDDRRFTMGKIVPQYQSLVFRKDS